MRKKIYDNLHRLVALIVMVIVIFTVVCSESYVVFAESTSFESQNVIDDLEGSTIAGVEFDLVDYPYNENGKPQLLNFVEYGYSFYSDNQDDYGLYIYVYNPQGYAITDNSSLNQIEMTIDGLSADTYPLEILNYSITSGYEGLFYKFKVALTDTQRTAALNALDINSRVYEITGLELTIDGTTTDYEVGAAYTYTGYALGYGSRLATESSLVCSVTGYDRYVTLDVQQTVYYPEGNYYNGEQVQLNSCYFGVPNEYLENYGTLTNILAEWYEYLTKPILITEDKDIFNALYSLYGSDLSNLSNNKDYLFVGLGNMSTILWGATSSSDVLTWSTNDYDAYVGQSSTYLYGTSTLSFSSGDLSEDNYFSNFAAVFYTGGTSYSEYSVSAEDLKDRFLLNSQYLANNGYSLDILDKYCSYLFEDYIDSVGNTTEHVLGYNKLDISSDDIVTIYSNTTSKSFWQNAFGGYSVTTDYDDISAIEDVSYSDIKSLTDSEISAMYFINEDDAAGFKAYVKLAESKDETVYIMRYGCANYSSMPIAQGYCSQDDDAVDTLCKNILIQWKDDEYSAYVCKETVYLDFDIISLTFTADDGVETVIPVVMSPQDVFSDTNPPGEEEYTDESGINWKLILSLILLVVLVIILFPVLPYIVKFVVWIILLPFKLISAIVKAFKKPKGNDENKKE